ncbi:MAG: VWA domain-containing protein [Planctomycetes bacterium]|nr:VWA domain-containing protein [Planctomycetota bacterium]
MSFLHPWHALLAAAVTIPLLLLLYFLKLRRRRLSIPSTLLWRKAFEDLQVNVPFQRLRLSALFLLQLILLLALLVALAEPTLTRAGPVAKRLIVLLDTSASMSALDAGEAGDERRLDVARRTALEIVDALAGRSDGAAAMLIDFGARARVAVGFESRRDVLAEAIAAIEPTDEEADLDAALAVAGTFTGRREQELEAVPDVILISDGGVRMPADAAGFFLRSGRFRYTRVGPETAANVGVVSLGARRDAEDPIRVVVFARLVNAGSEAVETTVRLFVDGRDGPIKRVRIEPARDGAAPGEATITFEIELGGGAVLTVRHGADDALPADDVAAVVLPPAVQPRIAFVHGDSGADARLRELLEESRPRRLQSMSAAVYAADAATMPDRFDLVVFDRVAPDELPDVPSLHFGAVPPGVTVTAPRGEGGSRILGWNRQHPVMRHVSLDATVYAGFGGMELPSGAESLATGPDGPVIALLRARGERHVVVGFALPESNWSMHVSIAVFLQNALEHLMWARSGRASLVSRPGEPVSVRVRRDTDAVMLRPPAEGPGPEAAPTPIAGAPGAVVSLPRLRRVGVYGAEGAEPPWDRIAVSMLSDVESDTRPVRELIVNAETVASGAPGDLAPRGVWPWLVAAALLLLVGEWLVYCRLTRG